MITKTKKKISLIIMAFLSCLCGLLCVSSQNSISYAAETTTPKYAVSFYYETWSSSNSPTKNITSSGTSTSATAQIAQYSTSTYTISIYGASSSGTGAFNGYINSSTVNIEVSATAGTPMVTVANSNGDTLANEQKSIKLTGLKDGTYLASFSAQGGWLVNSRWYNSVGIDGSFYFTVDLVAPTITGASTSASGKYVNTAFTVSATDSGALDNLYMKAPNTTSYVAVGSSKTISDGSTNGLYQFYAVDKAGNETAVHYVYYDNTKPTGLIKSNTGQTLTKQYIAQPFYYTATDSCGIYRTEYKTPSSTTWSAYVIGTTILDIDENGCYQFKATDRAGNVSNVTTIYLDTIAPAGILYGGKNVVTSGETTTAENISFVVSDAVSGINTIKVKSPNTTTFLTYTSGTKLTENGTYEFYAVDNAGNDTNTVSVTLDNTPPTLTLSSGSWGDTLSDGFTVSATDNITDTTLYYKTPDGQFVQSLSNSVTIPKTYADGKYEFYAVDGYGNQSEILYVTLYIEAPIANVIKSNNSNQTCVIWIEDNFVATLNGEEYFRGTWIKKEGDYTVVVTNDANRSSTYTFTIDHYYELEKTVEATCEEKGYTAYKCVHCNGTYNTDYVDELGHNYIVSKEVESTCTDDGYSIYLCTRCGDTYNDDVVSANGHDYGSWYIVTDSTCTEKGILRRECVSCGEQEDSDIEPKGHNYIGIVTNPTCTEQGYTTYTCDKCSDSYKENYINSLGHTYKATITAPTCTERGYTTQSCIRCDNSYVENYVDAKGHSYGVWKIATEPTCIKSGLRYKTCNVCDYRYNEVLSALGHSYVNKVIEPTCIEKGYTTHICSRCNTGYNDTFVNALGHDYQPITVESTCEEAGYFGQRCSRCSDIVKSQTLKAKGHNYIEMHQKATCEEEGCILHVCLECSYEYKSDVVSPTGHTFKTHVLLAATCEDDGERHYECEKCAFTKIDIIPAHGHNYEISEENNVDGVITRLYVCTICTATYTQDVGAQYEKVSNYVEKIFNDYSKYMVWVFLATAGVWSIAMGTVIIIASKNEDKAKAKKMITNYLIGLIVIFVILIVAPYLVRGIAYLVT